MMIAAPSSAFSKSKVDSGFRRGFAGSFSPAAPSSPVALSSLGLRGITSRSVAPPDHPQPRQVVPGFQKLETKLFLAHELVIARGVPGTHHGVDSLDNGGVFGGRSEERRVG